MCMFLCALARGTCRLFYYTTPGHLDCLSPVPSNVCAALPRRRCSRILNALLLPSSMTPSLDSPSPLHGRSWASPRSPAPLQSRVCSSRRRGSNTGADTHTHTQTHTCIRGARSPLSLPSLSTFKTHTHTHTRARAITGEPNLLEALRRPLLPLPLPLPPPSVPRAEHQRRALHLLSLYTTSPLEPTPSSPPSCLHPRSL